MYFLLQMDFFVYVLILMLVVGVIFVLYGSFARKGKKIHDDEEDLDSLAQKLSTLKASGYEAGVAVSALEDVSKNVFKELDSKYQELLFLYNLVDEKHKALSARPEPVHEADFVPPRLIPKVKDDRSIEVNPKIARAWELSLSGMGVDDIAKELQMGKGEVTLVINLERKRRNA